MKSFYNYIKDAAKYALNDWHPLLVIGIIAFVVSVNRKYSATNFTFWEIINVLMLVVVGYGSFVVWYAINGWDGIPEFDNMKMIVWEGVRKSCVIFVYMAVLTFLIHHIMLSYANGNVLLLVMCIVLFCFVYVVFVGGLINRYLHDGNVLEAFNLFKIIGLFSIFDANSFFRVLVSAVIAQLLAVSTLIDIEPEFTSFELVFSIAMLLLAPFLFIATKRLLGMHVHDLLEKNELKK